ncbi:MAG TPA: 2-oxo acid dehydrogenase subunit E2 [Solirubrobacteraceae bacterium]
MPGSPPSATTSSGRPSSRVERSKCRTGHARHDRDPATLSVDHRTLYGADAARFLADVEALLESPVKLVL